MMKDYVVEDGEIMIEIKEKTENQMLSRLKEYVERSTLEKSGKEDK